MIYRKCSIFISNYLWYAITMTTRWCEGRHRGRRRWRLRWQRRQQLPLPAGGRPRSALRCRHSVQNQLEHAEHHYRCTSNHYSDGYGAHRGGYRLIERLMSRDIVWRYYTVSINIQIYC